MSEKRGQKHPKHKVVKYENQWGNGMTHIGPKRTHRHFASITFLGAHGEYTEKSKIVLIHVMRGVISPGIWPLIFRDK
jgi:hypothetical protein